MTSLTPVIVSIAKNQFFEIHYDVNLKLFYTHPCLDNKFWRDFNAYHILINDMKTPMYINNIHIGTNNKIAFISNIGLDAVPFIIMIMHLVFRCNIMKSKNQIAFKTSYGHHVIQQNEKGLHYTFFNKNLYNI